MTPGSRHDAERGTVEVPLSAGHFVPPERVVGYVTRSQPRRGDRLPSPVSRLRYTMYGRVR
jgi:hypothetical protein